MRKTIGFCCVFVLLAAGFAGTLCAETGNTAQGKTAIVYFSKTGNTRNACEVLAKKLPGDLFELTVAKPPAARGQLPEVKPARINLEPYSFVVVASPIWAANLVPAMRAFLENNRLDGKTVFVLTTTDAPMPEKFQAKHKKLVSAAGGTVKAYYQLVMKEKKGESAEPRAQEQIQKDMGAIADTMHHAIAR